MQPKQFRTPEILAQDVRRCSEVPRPFPSTMLYRPAD